jgi:hypothetical protein
MGSGAAIYIPSFIKISSGVEKQIGGIYRYTDSMVIALVNFHFSTTFLILKKEWTYDITLLCLCIPPYRC